MATEENAAMSGVVMQDDTSLVERQSSTMDGGEHIDDVQRRDYDASTERHKAMPLDGPEAKRLKIDDDEIEWEKERLIDEKWREKYRRKREEEGRQKRLERFGYMKQTGFWPTHTISIIEGNYFVTSEISNGSSQNHSLHFEVKCLIYQRYDVKLEDRQLQEYDSWCHAMQEDPSAREDEGRANLFKGLHDALTEDDQASREETREREYDTGMAKGRSRLKLETALGASSIRTINVGSSMLRRITDGTENHPKRPSI